MSNLILYKYFPFNEATKKLFCHKFEKLLGNLIISEMPIAGIKEKIGSSNPLSEWLFL